MVVNPTLHWLLYQRILHERGGGGGGGTKNALLHNF